MCKTQFVLALAVLYLGLVHSWDIAVSLGNQLRFYTDGIKTNNVDLISHNATALAYDEVHNMMLYVDKQSNNDSICGYNLFSKEHKCFITRVDSNIQSIAFDPATDTLFFTDTTERSINWISLKPGFNNNISGNFLINTGVWTPAQIAVDSCRGYIYWVNKLNIHTEDIERARFNGSEREVMHSYMSMFSVATDPQTRKFYFIDGSEKSYMINSEGMDNHGWDFLSLNQLVQSNPRELTVSNEYLYWVNSVENYKTILQMPKNRFNNEEIKYVDTFFIETPVAIVANYKIKDQIQGLQDCEALSSLIPQSKTTVTDNSLNVRDTTETEQTTESTTLVGLSCVNGTEVSGMSVCKCIPGYIGGRCDVSMCENYCLQGDCSLNNEGVPKCRCKAGYSRERCEVYPCHGFCLNNGDCSLNEEDQPVCQCVGNHEGTRCEAAINDAFTNTQTFDLVKRKPSLADLVSTWRKPSSKMFITVEV